MKITSTPQQQQFNGCYVMKDTANAYKRFISEAAPGLRLIAPHHPILAVKEDLIFNAVLSERLAAIAGKTGYGRDWLIGNAAQHGVHINLEPSNDVYVFSGKDCGEVIKFNKSKNSLREKFAQFCHDVKIFRQSRELPPHLREVDYVNRKINLARDDFHNFAQSKNCKKVNGLSELMVELINEL